LLKWGLSGRGSNLLKSDRPLTTSSTPGCIERTGERLKPYWTGLRWRNYFWMRFVLAAHPRESTCIQTDFSDCLFGLRESVITVQNLPDMSRLCPDTVDTRCGTVRPHPAAPLRPATCMPHGYHLAAALAAAAEALIPEKRLYLDSCIDASSAAAAGASLVSGSFGLGGRGTATGLRTAGVREVAGVGARREEGTLSGTLVGLPVRGVTVRAGAAGRGDAVRAGARARDGTLAGTAAAWSEAGATTGAGSCSSSGKGTSSARRVSTRRSRPR
jgi:hypothetical protein